MLFEFAFVKCGDGQKVQEQRAEMQRDMIQIVAPDNAQQLLEELQHQKNDGNDLDRQQLCFFGLFLQELRDEIGCDNNQKKYGNQGYQSKL